LRRKLILSTSTVLNNLAVREFNLY